MESVSDLKKDLKDKCDWFTQKLKSCTSSKEVLFNARKLYDFIGNKIFEDNIERIFYQLNKYEIGAEKSLPSDNNFSTTTPILQEINKIIERCNEIL